MGHFFINEPLGLLLSKKLILELLFHFDLVGLLVEVGLAKQSIAVIFGRLHLVFRDLLEVGLILLLDLLSKMVDTLLRRASSTLNIVSLALPFSERTSENSSGLPRSFL